MTSDNRNIILAIVLSVAIIITWQYFFAQPMIEEQRQQQELAEQRAPTLDAPTAPGEILPPGVQGAAGSCGCRARTRSPPRHGCPSTRRA
jgi:YidC/Oxa1 family membrane protein insertase